MQRSMLWLAPITVMGFVVLLALMYGWVGKIGDLGSEPPEMGETSLTAQVQGQTQGVNQTGQPTAQADQSGQLAADAPFSAGIGNGQNGQIQFINQPTFPMGVGGDQMQLINQGGAQIDNQMDTRIGNPMDNQADQPAQAPQVGQLVHHGQFPAGIGNDQIQLIGQNQVAGPYLGVDLSDLSPALAKELDLAANGGVYVNAVLANSPAQKAGFMAGDLLQRCDHKPVSSLGALKQILAQKKAGDVIKLVVMRDGLKKSFQVRIENAPMGVNVGAAQNPVWIGADIQSVDAVMKVRFNLPDQKGAIVSYVAPNSPASAAGLGQGDVIRRFGDKRIRNVNDLQSLILKGTSGQAVDVTVLRNGQYQTLRVALGQKRLDTRQDVSLLPPADTAIEGSWIGMDVEELGPNEAADFGFPPGTSGILVTDVESPPATMVGFQSGDLIVAVNGMPTPDMKGFAHGTQKQAGAVVDVIRGNRHIFLSVPPPGFTQQGTKLNTGVDNRFKQVAMARPMNRKFAILTDGPDLNASVSGDMGASGYVILVDLDNNAVSALDANDLNDVAAILTQYNITALICSQISRQMAATLGSRGVAIYSGVLGRACDGIRLYQANQLIAMKGL